MADYPRQGASDGDDRSRSEQIRRLRTRIPLDGTTSTYQVVNADLNNDEGSGSGWFVEGVPYPSFVRQGSLILLSGMFHFFGPYTASGASQIMKVDKIPAQFRPYRAIPLPAAGPGFNDDHQWVVYVFPNGSLQVGDVHTLVPPAWMGDLRGATTDSLTDVVMIEAVYPAADLQLGDFTA